MDDKKLQKIRKAALEKTPEAMQAALRAEQRSYGVRTIWHCGIDGTLPIGEWIYVEVGPNFHEVGILQDMFFDEAGISIAVLSECARKQNETDDAGPTYLVKTGNLMNISRSSVHIVQLAQQRFGSKWKTP